MTDTQLGIGLIGCGAIGLGLAQAVEEGKVKGATLVAVFDQDPGRAKRLADTIGSAPSVAATFPDLLATNGVSLVVEAASQDAVRRYAEEAVSAGKHLLIMSSGALLDEGLFSRLTTLAQTTGCRVIAPSGALGGIDAIRASRHLLEEVVLTTRKHPSTLLDTARPPGEPAIQGEGAQVVFEGNALEAVKRFPFNVNVAATLSLAGIGPERTRVRIIADPQAEGNNHEVYARGGAGVLRFTMENVPHPENPRTSYLALLSGIEALRGTSDGGIRIGS